MSSTRGGSTKAGTARLALIDRGPTQLCAQSYTCINLGPDPSASETHPHLRAAVPAAPGPAWYKCRSTTVSTCRHGSIDWCPSTYIPSYSNQTAQVESQCVAIHPQVCTCTYSTMEARAEEGQGRPSEEEASPSPSPSPMLP